MDKNTQDTTQTTFLQSEKNKPNGNVILISIIIGFATNAFLWFVTWYIVDAMDHYETEYRAFGFLFY